MVGIRNNALHWASKKRCAAKNKRPALHDGCSESSRKTKLIWCSRHAGRNRQAGVSPSGDRPALSRLIPEGGGFFKQSYDGA